MTTDESRRPSPKRPSPSQQRFWAMMAGMAFLWLCLFAIAWISL